MEELAKAKLLYDAAAPKWSATLGFFGLPVRVSEDVMLPERLTTRRLPHSEKLQAAERFASGFGRFWLRGPARGVLLSGGPGVVCGGRAAAELGQQTGLCVGREVGSILSHLDIPRASLNSSSRQPSASRCISIDDPRQQDAPDAAAIDSVQDLRWSVLPYPHPTEFAQFVIPRDDDEILD